MARPILPPEQELALVLALEGIVAEREYAFHKTRAWRFDFAIPGARLAIEVEGGVHTGGRHTRGTGFTNDCEKYNAAMLLGWRVLRFVPKHVRNGVALATILEALNEPTNT